MKGILKLSIKKNEIWKNSIIIFEDKQKRFSKRKIQIKFYHIRFCTQNTIWFFIYDFVSVRSFYFFRLWFFDLQFIPCLLKGFWTLTLLIFGLLFSRGHLSWFVLLFCSCYGCLSSTALFSGFLLTIIGLFFFFLQTTIK